MEKNLIKWICVVLFCIYLLVYFPLMVVWFRLHNETLTSYEKKK